jgi:hypothetical protein
MKQSVKRLRETKGAYQKARDYRYRELADWDPYDADAREKHKKIVDQINLEESALDMEWPEQKPQITCGPVVNSRGEFARWTDGDWEPIDV